jgi:hypothetical protein
MDRVEPHLQTILNHLLPHSWARHFLPPYLLISNGFLPSHKLFEGFQRAHEVGLNEFEVEGRTFVLLAVGLGFQKWASDDVFAVIFGVTFRGNKTSLVSFCEQQQAGEVTQALGRVRAKLLDRDFKPA